MGNKSAKRASGFLGTSALTRPLFALGAATALFGAGPAHAIDANTLPQNPNVVGGKDSFAQSGNTLNVNQSTKRTVIDWRSFDIGSKAQVNFNQPGTSAIAVNRVNSSANPTQIEGGLHANGQVWILNPNGVFFGKTAHVDAAGIVASTANIDTNAFMAGSNKLQMTGADHGAVENQGNISVGQAGLAAFVAPSVRNSGTINATVGRVALAAGTTYTLDLAGDHLVELGLGSVKAVVDNSGKIVNPGGTIALTAKAASQVVSSVVNVSGTVSASSVTNSGGTITLGGDNVTTTSTAQLSADAGTNGNGGAITSVANVQGNYAGSFSAKGGSQSGNGGSVETSGKSVTVADGISVDTRAPNGILGNWTVDPLDVTITSGSGGGLTGSSITTGAIEDALSTTDVTITTDQTGTDDGDLNLAGSINAAGSTGNLTLTGRHLYETNASTINLGGALTLNVNTVNNTANPTGSWISDALGMVGAVSGGTTVNVGAGTYNENVAINKSNVALLSTDGSATTIINGQGGSADGQDAGVLGTVLVTAGANNFTLGGISHGFTILGLNNASPGIESAAVYFQGANSGSTVQGNDITARGDSGLETEYNLAVTGLVIDSNTFDGQTFVGPHGLGSADQFTVADVPRQAVVIQNGSSNVAFTNNTVTAVTGGFNPAGQEQGNTLVTIDSNGATITGNTFAGTTDYGSDALRARGTNTVVTGNTFDGTNMAEDTAMLEIYNSALVGNFSDLVAANTFTNGSAWVGHSIGTDNYVFRGINNAITTATPGDTINVGDGTYNESVNINKANLTLQSVNLHGAVIDAGNAAFGISVSSTSGNLGTITIDGFTVRDWNTGGIIQGMSAGPFASMHVTNNLVYGPPSGAVANGNGIEVSGDGSVVSGNEVHFVHLNSTEWSGSGIIAVNGSNITVEDNVVDTADVGIAVTNWSNPAGMTNIVINRNTVTNSGDEGISVQAYEGAYNGVATGAISDLTVTNNTVTGGLSGLGIWDYSGYTYIGGVSAETNPKTGDWSTTVANISGNTFADNAYQISTDFTAGDVTPFLGTNTFDATAVNTADNTAIYGDLQTAVGAASAGDTLDVAGTFTTNGQIAISQNLTITGDATARATITSGMDMTNGSATGAWILVDPNVTFNLSNVVIDGGSHTVYQALRNEGNTTVDNVDFRNIGDASNYVGEAIESFGGYVVGGAGADSNPAGSAAASLTVTNSTFENIGRIGILVKGEASTANITGITYTGKGAGDWLDYGIEFGAGGTGTVSDSTITGALGIASVDGSTSAGIQVTSYYGPGTQATIENNTITGNWAAVDVGYDGSDTSVVHASGNDFSGNTHGVELESSLATADFSGNWWGSTDAGTILASMTGADASLVDISPFLMSGTDTSTATGFQGDFSNLTVTAQGGGDANRIQEGIADVSTGGTVNVDAGSYTLSSELDITKSLSLVGAGIGSTNITSNSTGYGIYVTADDVSLSGFTYNAPTAVGATYGIKVDPGTNVASDRVTGFNIDHVTINGGYRTGLDLNGVDGATIDNVSVSNVVHGNGIGLTDSANVTLTNDTTANNAWGGLALYQMNTYYDQQVNNIVVDGTNTFNDTIPVYTEDQSASQNFGSISLAGFSYVVQSPNAANDVYSWFQKTKQAAFDFATNASLSNGNVNVPTATVQGYGGSGAYGNNVFYVGTGSNSDAMSIDNAVDQATTGGTVNVDAGTYAEDVAVGTQLSFNFGGSGVTVNSLTVGSGGAGSTLGGNLTATGAIALNGATTVNGNLKTASFASNATLAMTGNLTASGAASLGGASTVKGNVQAASFTSNAALALTGNLSTSGAAALNGASSVTGNVSTNSLTTGSTLALVGDITATNGVTLGGASTVTGNISAASLTASDTLGLTGNLTTSGASVLNGASTITGNVQADTLSTGGTLAQVGNIAATNGVILGGASTVTGNVSAKTFTSNSTLALNGGLTASGAAQFNGATTVNGNVQAGSITAANSFGLTGNATATGAIALNGANTLAGTLTGGSIALGATTLTGSTSLNTSGSNGAIQVASVDGGHALSLNAGTGAISLGNVGATTALASLTDASATTLTGATYNAGSFLFGGDVTLTAATTTLSTGGGDITFTGDIFGTADSAQSLTLNAGPGTGSPSANGNITLDNAGTSSVWLGDVTVSGNNFTANTVYVGGNYTSTLTGNQVFAADTLHTRGNVDSTVGGDASGHIDAAGDVNISAGGDVSGTIGGNNVTLTGDDVNANVTAQSNASVTGNTVEGNYAANTVGIVAQNNVNAAVNATNFQLVAASGSVNGTWTNYTVGGSGTVYLNGDPQIGVNPSQLVVEGFTLPAGTTIGANGQLILPQGVLLGLLSPGGGKPKMILVHTVQELGQLLADGYSVIVIDLSGNDKDKPIQLASN